MRNILPDLVELQSQGAKGKFEENGRKGGAGPADDKAFMFGSHTVMVPTLNNPAKKSEFKIEDINGQLVLKRQEKVLGPLTQVKRPRFYDLYTKDGISYRKIALLHGSDCAASTVVQECFRWDDLKQRCHFCAIGVSLKDGTTIHTKSPAQLAEVMLAAKKLDGVTHVTLTTGTPNAPNKGAEYLGECAHAVKKATGLPVHVQFEPPEEMKVFEELKKQGVDNVGIHIESFDPDVRKRITPGKASIKEDIYFEAFDKAITVFGQNQVSTYVILGLGEDEELTVDKCNHVIKMGVYPFLVPLRPILNTYMANITPPSSEYLMRIYTKVVKMMNKAGINSEKSNSGCVKCSACSMQQFLEKNDKS